MPLDVLRAPEFSDSDIDDAGLPASRATLHFQYMGVGSSFRKGGKWSYHQLWA